MSSTLAVYLALARTASGRRQTYGTTPATPIVEIDCDADTSIDRTLTVAAGESATVYDFAEHGDFEALLLLPDGGDLEVWVQGGTPTDDSAVKGDLTWQPRETAVDGRPMLFSSSAIRTNATAATHAADDGADAPLGASDSSEEDGRVHKIVVYNRGDEDVLLRVASAG